MLSTYWGFGALVIYDFLISAVNAQANVGKSFVIGEAGALVVSRLDPIVSPGGYAGHVHRVIGGSAFTATLNDPEALLKSSCTTLRTKADKSNYWTPSLYFINKDGTYSLTHHVTKVYYSMPQRSGGVTKYHAFPPGMRILNGLGGRRDPGAIQVQGFQLNMDPYCGWSAKDRPPACANADLTIPVNNRFLANGTTHPRPPAMPYVHLNIHFPSCGWANQSLDSWDHFSHMTWPVEQHGDWNPVGTACPESHPIKYPTIFLENFHYLDDRMKAEWNPTGSNLILANGDVTGITYHADFVAGWDHDALQQALDTCGNIGDRVEDCPPLKNDVTDSPFTSNCRTESKIPTEDVGVLGPLKYLPGCNPRWDWDGPAKKPTDCPWYKGEPGWAAPNLMWTHGARENFPVAIPGLNENEALNMKLPGGHGHHDGESALFARWGLNSKLDGNVTTPIQRGTQEEINQAAQNPAKVLGVNSFTGLVQDKYRLSAMSIQYAKSLTLPNGKWSTFCKNDPYAPLPCVNQLISESKGTPVTQCPAS